MQLRRSISTHTAFCDMLKRGYCARTCQARIRSRIGAGRVADRRHRGLPDSARGHGGARREDKIAAIGVRIKRWVTLHGIALNIDCDLSHYAGIVPCGVSEPRYGVTSLADLGRAVSRAEFDAALQHEFAQLFGPVAPA